MNFSIESREQLDEFLSAFSAIYSSDISGALSNALNEKFANGYGLDAERVELTLREVLEPVLKNDDASRFPWLLAGALVGGAAVAYFGFHYAYSQMAREGGVEGGTRP